MGGQSSDSSIQLLSNTYVESTADFITLGSGILLIFLVIGLFISFLKGVR